MRFLKSRQISVNFCRCDNLLSNFAVRHRTSARDAIASECKLSERKLIRVLTARESRRLAARFCRLLKTCTFGLCYVIGIAVERSLCASNVEIARVNIHSSFSFLLGSKTPLFFVCPQRLSFIFLPLFSSLSFCHSVPSSSSFFSLI